MKKLSPLLIFVFLSFTAMAFMSCIPDLTDAQVIDRGHRESYYETDYVSYTNFDGEYVCCRYEQDYHPARWWLVIRGTDDEGKIRTIQMDVSLDTWGEFKPGSKVEVKDHKVIAKENGEW